MEAWYHWDSVCGVLVVVSSLIQMAQGANTTKTEESSGPFKTDMIQGLAIGFGAMVGGIILLCIIWFLCCGNACQKNQPPKPELRPVRGRVAPSPTQRPGAVTRSNIRASS